MQPVRCHISTQRAIIQVSGEDRQAFLQGLISNDIRKVAVNRAIYAILLTPQGRFLFDLFLAEKDGSYLIDCESARKADLLRRLSMYRLRSKVALTDVGPDWRVCLLHGPGTFGAVPLAAERGAAGPLGGGIAFTDPRLPALGVRAMLPRTEVEATIAALGAASDDNGLGYDRLRASLGVPEPVRDLIPEKSLLLESGLDELNAIDWEKGCYMGQELTARSKYRGLVRKRLFPVEIVGLAPEPGAPLFLGAKEVGEMRGLVADGRLGLALIRLEAFTESDRPILTSGSAEISPVLPTWMSLPDLQATH
jgi:folate-binding protein YgfZ